MPFSIENLSFKIWADTALYNPLLGSLFHDEKKKRIFIFKKSEFVLMTYSIFLQIRDATAVDIETINQEDEFLQLMQNCGERRLLKVSIIHVLYFLVGGTHPYL